MRTLHLGGGDEPGPRRRFELETPLTPEEARVLGCLVEKEILTPDIYPLTVNSLVNACNQKTSRDPVVQYDDATVDAVLTMLQGRGLTARISGAEHRVPKYRQLFTDAAGLTRKETAVMTVLLLRGPQTPGELNQRTGRLYEFASIEEVEETIERLIEREPPMAARLERLPGTKEARYAHLLGGPIEAAAVVPSTPAVAPLAVPKEDRLARLEAEVAALREDLENVKAQFAEFQRQFE